MDFHIIGIVTSNFVVKELMCNATSTVTYLATGMQNMLAQVVMFVTCILEVPDQVLARALIILACSFAAFLCPSRCIMPREDVKSCHN